MLNTCARTARLAQVCVVLGIMSRSARISQCQQHFAMSVACQSLTRGLGAVEGFYAGEVLLVGAKAISAVGQDIVPNSYVLWIASDAGAATFSVTLAPG